MFIDGNRRSERIESREGDASKNSSSRSFRPIFVCTENDASRRSLSFSVDLCFQLVDSCSQARKSGRRSTSSKRSLASILPPFLQRSPQRSRTTFSLPRHGRRTIFLASTQAVMLSPSQISFSPSSSQRRRMLRRLLLLLPSSLTHPPQLNAHSRTEGGDPCWWELLCRRRSRRGGGGSWFL